MKEVIWYNKIIERRWHNIWKDKDIKPSDPKFSETLGYRISKIRNKLNLSQAKFAKLVYSDRTTIASWELNRRRPDMDMLLLIANLGGVTLEWLYGIKPIKKGSIPSSRVKEWNDLALFCEEQGITPLSIRPLIIAAIQMHVMNK